MFRGRLRLRLHDEENEDRVMRLIMKVVYLYELSSDDVAAIELINCTKKENEKMEIISRRCSMSGKYYLNVVCTTAIKEPENKEYYDALDKIKSFSEREVIKAYYKL